MNVERQTICCQGSKAIPLISMFTVVFEKKYRVGQSGKRSKKKIGYLVFCVHNVNDMSLYFNPRPTKLFTVTN